MAIRAKIDKLFTKDQVLGRRAFSMTKKINLLDQTNASRLPQRFSAEEKQQGLEHLATQAEKSRTIPFKQSATQLVRGEGPLNARIMLIGEGPGRDEDLQGRPFVGRSGKLLTKVLEECLAPRSSVYISNLVKYRPPNNRTPTHTESMIWAKAYLFKEIKLIRPEVIITLGSSSTKALLGENIKLGDVRAKTHALGPITLIPAYHPAYILRNPPALEKLQESFTLAKQVINNFVDNSVDNLSTNR